MKHFWNWIHDDSGGRTLRLEGPIDAESFWGDEITPRDFRDELEADEGDIIVWINSPGGNVFAAAEIYTMLRDYRGDVTVKIASLAASAASVVAMAGDRVQMSPTALLMIHDPSTIAMGNTRDMERAITTLNEVKESIINAYAAKSGLRRSKISELMENETWINAKKAVELGLADEVLYENQEAEEVDPEEEESAEDNKEEEDSDLVLDEIPAILFSGRQMNLAIMNHLRERELPAPPPAEPDAPVIGMDGKTKDGAMPYELLRKQLDFLK